MVSLLQIELITKPLLQNNLTVAYLAISHTSAQA